jgi:hypothetical protein
MLHKMCLVRHHNPSQLTKALFTPASRRGHRDIDSGRACRGVSTPATTKSECKTHELSLNPSDIAAIVQFYKLSLALK